MSHFSCDLLSKSFHLDKTCLGLFIDLFINVSEVLFCLLFWSQQGLCYAVRKEAWKFLLGYFPWNSTHEERKLLQKSKTYACFPQRIDSIWLKLSFVRLSIHKIMCSLNSDEYFRMKLQWKSVSEEQERRNSRLRDYRSLIGVSLNTLQVLFFSCF